ncbi:hypothetical protein MUK42_36694 [Musa troglodytarum]|uniref:Uncharacterized protein n=1 Tax=Musa troglodytarum TaxID=320322 RepID=A0A9E7KGN3_9LILI|nr:hypothetical protein MUK42_36694 [Musa troglodytarum]
MRVSFTSSSSNKTARLVSTAKNDTLQRGSYSRSHFPLLVANNTTNPTRSRNEGERKKASKKGAAEDNGGAEQGGDNGKDVGTIAVFPQTNPVFSVPKMWSMQ